jgi:hypothetical protein
MKSYSEIGEMMGDAKDVAVENAGKFGVEARDKAVTAWSGALAMAKNVSEFFRHIRDIGVDDVLGSVGLMRKPTFGRVSGAFLTGFALGAGAGVLFAPKSGKETRRAIGTAFGDVFSTTKGKLYLAKDKVTAAAKERISTATKDGADLTEPRGANPSDGGRYAPS